MDVFEWEIDRFKIIVKNKVKVEESICQAYISKKTSNFCSHYFEPHVQSRRTRVGQNDDGGESSIDQPCQYSTNMAVIVTSSISCRAKLPQYP